MAQWCNILNGSLYILELPFTADFPMNRITPILSLCLLLTQLAYAQKTSSQFELTLDPTFYMAGDDLNDLYIGATITQGTLKVNTTVDIVKVAQPAEKVQAQLYNIEDKAYQSLPEAKAGDKVLIFLKVNNDKKFPLGHNAKEYRIVAAGTAVAAQTSSSKAKFSIKLNGQERPYNYHKVYHYTKAYGVTKSPPSLLITFTNPAQGLKNTPEELVELHILTGANMVKSYPAQALECTFNGWVNGQEITYSRNKTFTEPATCTITTYQSIAGKTYISGTFTCTAKHYLCSTCPKANIEISFENLEVELYDK